MDKILPEIKLHRKPEHEISKIILNRWSARAMSGDALQEEELLPLFEAAKWAPSAMNSQPWRFIYALKNTDEFKKLFDLMLEGNKIWGKNAGALALLISRKNYEYNEKPNTSSSFVTGAALQNFLLEGTSRGYVVHPIQGFDSQRAYSELGIPESYNVECMVVIGKKGKAKDLQEDLQKRETPSQRKKLDQIIMKGKFEPEKEK